MIVWIQYIFDSLYVKNYVFFSIRRKKSVNFLATEKKLRYNETKAREKQQKNI